MKKKWWICAATALVLLHPAVDAGKSKKSKQAEQQAPPAAATAPTVDVWTIYQGALAEKQNGNLEEAARRLEEAAVHPSDPVVWCYSRLHLADIHFRQGNAADAADAREASYLSAQRRFQEVLYCIGQEGAEDVAKRLSEQELQAVEAFRGFGTTDLAAELEQLSFKQGEDLIQEQNYEAAVDYWRFLADLFGETRQTRFNVALACFEQGDLDCAAAEILAAQELPRASADDPSGPVEVVVQRALETADAPGDRDADSYFTFALDLLTRWHELEPLERQPREILEQIFLPVSREERLRRLGLAENCWVPIHIAERLREDERDYKEEASIASECESGGTAGKSMLVEAYYYEAKDAWNALRPLSMDEFNDAARVRAHLREIRPAMENLDKALAIDAGYAPALELKAKVTAYMDQMKVQRKDLVAIQETETAEYCKQKWSSFSWWGARRSEMLSQTPSVETFDAFQRECKTYVESEGLRDQTSAMREDIVEALMLVSCEESWRGLKASPDSDGLTRFERDCSRYVEVYDVQETLEQIKNQLRAGT